MKASKFTEAQIVLVQKPAADGTPVGEARPRARTGGQDARR